MHVGSLPEWELASSNLPHPEGLPLGLQLPEAFAREAPGGKPYLNSQDWNTSLIQFLLRKAA